MLKNNKVLNAILTKQTLLLPAPKYTLYSCRFFFYLVKKSLLMMPDTEIQ